MCVRVCVCVCVCVPQGCHSPVYGTCMHVSMYVCMRVCMCMCGRARARVWSFRHHDTHKRTYGHCMFIVYDTINTCIVGL